MFQWQMFRKKQACIIFIAFFAFVPSLFAQNSSASVRISGASTIQPIIAGLSSALQVELGKPLVLEGGGSGIGIRDVQNGTAMVGMVSRSLSAEEISRVQYTTIGLDTLVFIVNIRNPLDNITREDIVRLYTQSIENWHEMSHYDGAVVLVNKEIGRSTLDLFEAYTGLKHPGRGGNAATNITRNVIEIGSNLEVVTLVGGLPGAIGYVSLGTAAHFVGLGMPIKILTLDGVTPSIQSIIARNYPIRRELNLVYRENTTDVQSILKVLLSPSGQDAVAALGFVRIK